VTILDSTVIASIISHNMEKIADAGKKETRLTALSIV
jgi:hypothetical protein